MSRSSFIAVGIAIATLTSLGAPAADLEYFGNAQKKQPFSEAVRAGDFLFVSGQIGAAAGSDPEATFKAATRRAMDEIARILTAHGSSLSHVVQCTVMLADMRMWPAFNAVYITYFQPGRLPARSAFGANGLAHGAPLEVSCFAYEPTTRP